MVDLPTADREIERPGRVADWAVEIAPSDRMLAMTLAQRPPFAAQTTDLGGALSGAAPPLIRFARQTHLAQIDADAEVGLGGGSFAMVLYRAVDRDWQRLTAAKAECDKAGALLVATVKLGWNRSQGVLGVLGPSGAGLAEVGRYAVTEITPAVDGVSWRLTLRGRELFAQRLSGRHVVTAGSEPTAEEAAALVLRMAGVTDAEIRPVPMPGPVGAGTEPPPVVLDLGAELLGEMRRLGEMMEAQGRRRGRSPYLLREGVLSVGVGRDVPFSGEILRVSAASGLIAYAETGRDSRNPGFSFRAGLEAGAVAPVEPMRRSFRLELVGAPDIRPGEVVKFPVAADPLAAAALAAQAAPAALLAGGEDWDNAVALYVATVSHRIDRNRGFLTTVSGVEVFPDDAGEDAFWDVPVAAPQATDPGVGALSDDGTPEGALAGSVAQHVRRELRRVARADIGEVTATEPGTPQGDGRGLASSVLRGLADSPAGAARSTRAAVWRENQTPIGAVPYATPFAWGRYGLVLPRYPGTRVVMLHAEGNVADPVDIGALWHGEVGADAAGPAQAEAGDWWLSLPAGVDPADAEAATAGPVMPPADGKASNDLIDAGGTRIIEVGRLVIRVGDDALSSAGSRPIPGDTTPAAGIVIEQVDGGARIEIDQGGKITIKAKDVVVEVSGTMDVKAG